MMATHLLPSAGYHIHVYCEVGQIPMCQELQERLLAEVPEIEGAGKVRNRPVGPHPLPMFEAWFAVEHLDKVVRWGMANRRGLSIMIHPLSGNDLEDHRDHAIWMGTQLPLNLDIFE
jgi:aromatic ring-cleaving dioxygenase